MKYAMVSQPMRGKTEDEIRKTREQAKTALMGLGYATLDNTGGTLEPIEVEYMDWINIPLQCLAESLHVMAKCEAVMFCDGWENARGCKIEHEAAKAYGLKIYYMRTPQRVTIKPVGGGEDEERVLFETEHNGITHRGYSDGGFFVKE